MHFQSLFIYGVRYGTNIIFLYIDFWLSQHHLLKIIPPHPTELSWHSCQQSVDHECESLFRILKSISLILYVYPYASILLSCLCTFEVDFKLEHRSYPTLFF